MKETRTMVSPQPGFADRVMERVQEYKRAQARQRMVIAVGLLVIALAGLLALAALQFVLQLEELATLTSTLASLLVVAAPVAEQVFTLLDALWLSVTSIVESINSIFLVAYACAVVGLTFMWLRVAFGPFQYLLKLSWRIEP